MSNNKSNLHSYFFDGRDLIMHIRKQSLEKNADGSCVWAFSTSVSAIKHKEWELRESRAHIGLMTDTQQVLSAVGKAITEFQANDFNDTKPDTFLKVRPDGVTFNEKAKVCAFLEFMRPMDSRDGASEQPNWYIGADWSLDWAQDKDLEENTRYACHLEYIWWASRKNWRT